MNHKRFLIGAFFATIWLLYSCNHNPDRSFYYWKTVFKLSKLEKSYLEDLKISHLYIRFFDVDWNESIGKPVPLASINFTKKDLLQVEVIPVVFIVNKTLLKTTFKDVEELAYRILAQTNYLASKYNISFNELQLDCDWTERTKENYFALLKILKKNLEENGKELSATIRLHQIKYLKITGVPPVHRGMLMYYNMGKITPAASENSVFNETDAAKYIYYISDYPLKLDIALPAFSWGIQIRSSKVIELLNNMSQSDFKNNNKFTSVDSSTFKAMDSFFFRGYYFMKNDLVKVEEVTPSLCKIAGKQLKNKLAKSTRRVAIFHLDSLILSKYEKKDFEEIFSSNY